MKFNEPGKHSGGLYRSLRLVETWGFPLDAAFDVTFICIKFHSPLTLSSVVVCLCFEAHVYLALLVSFCSLWSFCDCRDYGATQQALSPQRQTSQLPASRLRRTWGGIHRALYPRVNLPDDNLSASG